MGKNHGKPATEAGRSFGDRLNETLAKATNATPRSESTKAEPFDWREASRKVLGPLASLRLTVVLFAFATAIVFIGTLALVELGLWTAVDQYFRSFYVEVPVRLFAHAPGLKGILPPASDISDRLWFPFPGGWLIGSLLFANLLAAHLVRFRISWKRSGILILHAGLLVLMAWEVFAKFAYEGKMAISAGERGTYIVDRDRTELAIIDASNPKADDVVVIPESLLRKGGTIRDANLPFAVEVLEYMPNSKLKSAEGRTNRANAGIGKEVVAERADEVAGTDTSGQFDIPSAYVTLRDKQTSAVIGTYLVSVRFSRVEFMWKDEPQPVPVQVEVGGKEEVKTYDLILRLARTYKPYAIQLLEFRFDRHPGTDQAKNYSSKVRLIDPARNEDREVLIKMNEPFFYGGETYYQSSFDGRTEKGTILTVARNHGWFLAYLGCAMVAAGMLVHFSILLYAFLQKPRGPRRVRTAFQLNYTHFVAGGVVALSAGLVLWATRSPKADGPIDIHAFGKLPALYQGRYQPMDSVARHALMIISNKQEATDGEGKKQPAIKWLLDVMAHTPAADKYKVFRIDNDQLLGLLDLEPRPEFYKYSLEELRPNLDKLHDQAKRAFDLEPGERGLFQRKALDLYGHLVHYHHFALWQEPRLVPSDSEVKSANRAGSDDLRRGIERMPVWFRYQAVPMDVLARETLLALSGRPEARDEKGDPIPPLQWLVQVAFNPEASRVAEFRVLKIDDDRLRDFLTLPGREEGLYALREIAPRIKAFDEQVKLSKAKPAKDREPFDLKVLELDSRITLLERLANTPLPEPTANKAGEEDWQTLRQSLSRLARHTDRTNPALRSWDTMLTAYQAGDAERFNNEVAAYHDRVANTWAGETNRARFEQLFNHAQFFYWAIYLYVSVLLLACIGWLGYSELFQRVAYWLMVLTLVVHTAAILLRMYIHQRPPVTNLYTTGIFIGWVCVLLAVILEPIYRNGLANALAGIIGFFTLIVAHNLSLDNGGDTFGTLVAVLDTNFWLATHVTIVNMGYAATFLVGCLGAVLILRGVFTPTLTPDALGTLGRMMYGILCFAMFCSFTGTVLGGLWADYSWGRFWGWDPKENGALLIVIWNALVLHARWAGMIKQRGMAVLTVFGNIITIWSWFATNMLPVGLHTYGPAGDREYWVSVAWLIHLSILFVGLMPLKTWWSHDALMGRSRVTASASA